jgi:hypothetical protein
MATFVRGYIEPGVYVESEIKPTPVIGTVGNFVPVLIGTWDSYTRTESDAITKGSGDSALVKLNGENVDVSLVDTNRGSAVNLTTSAVYTIGTDFELGDGGDDNLQITWLTDGNKPQQGTTYVVYFYLKKSVDDYEPKFFYSTQVTEALNFLGQVETDSSGNIKYSLPLGFSIAIANGASSVWCISWKDINGSKRDVSTILTELQTLKNPDGSYPYSIVFLGGYMSGQTSDLTFAEVSAIVNHVRQMSSVDEQKERIVIFGPPAGVTENETNYRTTIGELKDRRVIYCYPANVKVTVGTTAVTVGGYYLGAAIAGLIDSLAMSAPLTGQIVAGFNEVVDPLLRVQKNSIASAGCLIVEDNFRIRHALTTDQTNPITGELKITRIVDYLMRLMRNSLTAFVNQPYSAGLLSTISMSVKLILTQLANANIIIDYRDINVVRNSTEPRQVDVSFAVRPTFDINWIYVKFTVEA